VYFRVLAFVSKHAFCLQTGAIQDEKISAPHTVKKSSSRRRWRISIL
jgi:hypothetical protein